MELTLTRGDKNTRKRVAIFFYPLINSDKILIYNRATHIKVIGHNHADVGRARALQPSSR